MDTIIVNTPQPAEASSPQNTRLETLQPASQGTVPVTKSAGQLDTEIALLEKEAKIAELKAQIATHQAKTHAKKAEAEDDDDDDDDYSGKSYPIIVMETTLKVPGVSSKDIYDILTGKFKTARFAYLRRRVYNAAEDLNPVVMGANNEMKSTNKKLFSVKQFDNNLNFWLECALNYLQIYMMLFGQQHMATAVAFTRFINFTMSQSRIFNASDCVTFALATFDVNRQERHNPEKWSMQDELWLRDYFHDGTRKNQLKRSGDLLPYTPSSRRPRFTAPAFTPPAMAPSRSEKPWDSPDWDKSFCYSFNNFKGGCRFGTACKMKHSCWKCKENHPGYSCANN